MNRQRPLQIGVTGGIGSGKSTVCRVFEALGAPVYEADKRAIWLTNHDPILKADIIRLLGGQAYDEAGRYNRPWVAAQVFRDPDLLTRLNGLIHPRVFADTISWAESHREQPYVIKEAALMRAAGDGNTLDKVIVVQAPVDIRIQRILRRDPHRTELDIRHIINSQISDEERLKMADYILYNDERHLLIPQIVHLHNEFFESQRS
ncbi:dephospho-CoA kinase [Nibrella saemangeumensis]|uniref:Dephospho-CoA kinase n=1 Tax=Nibrella saemangeumensis TaxID=1084526 RepID=A0ABP8NRR1_9BACT